MSEERMVEIAEKALVDLGVPETVEAAGQFLPRGHTGSMFAGGFLGDGLTDMAGGLVNSAATVGGALAGAHIHDAASGLPDQMLVGVTSTHVCGWAQAHRNTDAGALVFRIPRRDLEIKVHKRVNVRILELIETSSGARIELEGNRIPLTHSKDVIQALAR
jgi:hypothetical protein